MYEPGTISVKTYEQRQKEWLQENNLKEGDSVKIIKKFCYQEQGFFLSWINDMDKSLGKTYKILSIMSGCIKLENKYGYPYFSLEPAQDKKILLLAIK